MEYFRYLPIIEYSDNQATNILVRGAVRDYIKNNIYTYYPYDVTDSDRPDIVADWYYGNSRYAWLIFYANDIVDPYYGWPFTYREFKDYIEGKYGDNSEIILSQEISFDADTKSLNSTDASTKDILRTIKPGQDIEITDYVGPNSGIFTVINQSDNDDNLSLSLIPGIKVLGELEIELPTTIVTQPVGNIKIDSANPHTTLHHFENENSSSIDYRTYISIPEFDEAGDPVPKRVVSKYRYEYELNESKRSIKIIDNLYRERIVNEIEELFT